MSSDFINRAGKFRYPLALVWSRREPRSKWLPSVPRSWALASSHPRKRTDIPEAFGSRLNRSTRRSRWARCRGTASSHWRPSRRSTAWTSCTLSRTPCCRPSRNSPRSCEPAAARTWRERPCAEASHRPARIGWRLRPRLGASRSLDRAPFDARGESQVHHLPGAVIANEVEMVDTAVADLAADTNHKWRPHHCRIPIDLDRRVGDSFLERRSGRHARSELRPAFLTQALAVGPRPGRCHPTVRIDPAHHGGGIPGIECGEQGVDR